MVLATLPPGSSWARRSRRIAAVELSAPARVQRRTPRSADPPPCIDVTPLVPRSPLVHHPGQRPSLADECDVWPQQERWRDVHGPIARSGRSSPWWPWRKSRAAMAHPRPAEPHTPWVDRSSRTQLPSSCHLASHTSKNPNIRSQSTISTNHATRPTSPG